MPNQTLNTMKKLKQLSIFGFALSFILSSCAIEKRHYMAGYSISWKNANHLSKTIGLVKNYTDEEIKSGNKNNVEQILTTDQIETSVADNSEVNNITASTDKSIFIPATPKIDLHINKKQLISENIPTSEIKTIIKEQKKNNKKAAKPASEERRSNGLAIASFICGILAILFCLLFVLEGAALALIVAIVSLILANFFGFSSLSRSDKGGKGFAIAGLIIGVPALLLLVLGLVLFFYLY